MAIYRHKVQYYETDKMGIVHHSNYIRWMEEARIDFLGQIGWEFKKLEEMGIVSPVTAVDCKYKVSTYFADNIDITVVVEEFKGVKLKLRYEMRRGEELVCEGRSEHCFMNEEGKIVSMKREYPAFFETLAKLANEN
uniref:acyl-CoA thioesterase n=1 Tax=Acetatifactor sp. TaxID=1872090 RepID=UPI0040564E1E